VPPPASRAATARFSNANRGQLVQAILEETKRLNRLVQNQTLDPVDAIVMYASPPVLAAASSRSRSDRGQLRTRELLLSQAQRRITASAGRP
jgi:hypothetical protein